MLDDEFCSLVDLLDGVADDASVSRLAEKLATLPPARVEAFQATLETHIDRVLDSPAVPLSLMDSDAAEWFAAAVVAAGRSMFEGTLRAQNPLSEDTLEFGEAESLLMMAEEDAVEAMLVAEFGELGPEWGVPVVPDPQVDAAREDIAGSHVWRSWLAAPPVSNGSACVDIRHAGRLVRSDRLC